MAGVGVTPEWWNFSVNYDDSTQIDGLVSTSLFYSP